MNLKYFDAHSHIHGKEYDLDREEVIARMREAGVGAITVGTDMESSRAAVELAEKNENIWATIGVHPTDTEEIFDEKEYEELAQSKKVVAIGECGLDYFRVTDDFEEEVRKQKDNFKRQIEFALKIDKPLMIHCRPSNKSTDAHEDMFDILSLYEEEGSRLRGNIHFFTGSSEIAEKYFELGFTVSIPGVVTFSKEVAQMAKNLPLNKILSETDCPYATPMPFRGKRNEPIYVIETVKYLANLRGESEEVVAESILGTAKTLFSISIT